MCCLFVADSFSVHEPVFCLALRGRLSSKSQLAFERLSELEQNAVSRIGFSPVRSRTLPY